MKKKVMVTLVYPVSFETEIDTSKEDYEIRNQLYDEADKLFQSSSIDSIVTKCKGYEQIEE